MVHFKQQKTCYYHGTHKKNNGNTSRSALGCRKKKGFRTGDLEREIRQTYTKFGGTLLSKLINRFSCLKNY